MIYDPLAKRYTMNTHTFLQWYFSTKEDRTNFADRLIQKLASNDEHYMKCFSCRILMNECKTVPGFLLNEDNDLKIVDSRRVTLIQSKGTYEIV
jgi:hypothetical protein